MKYQYWRLIICLSLICVATCRHMSFILIKPTGEILEGNREELKLITDDVEKQAQKISGGKFQQIEDEYADNWLDTANMLSQARVPYNEIETALSNVYWDYVENVYSLIGWDLLLKDRETAF